MRLVKMLGLTMAAAIAAMAFIGTGTAAAQEHWVVLCKENPTELCPGAADPGGAKLYKHISLNGNLETLGGPAEPKLHAVLLNTFVEELCEKSTVNGNVTVTSPVHGEITAVTFSECTPCPNVEILNLPYLIEVKHNAVGNAHLWLATIKPIKVGTAILADIWGGTVCGAAPGCKFEAKEIDLGINNTATGLPLLLAVKAPLTPENFCGLSAAWDANYLSECLEPAGTRVNCWLALDKLKEA